MAPVETPTSRDRGLTRLAVMLADVAVASVPRLAFATFAGAVLLVAPIAVWASLGDGDLLRTALVALAALLLSFAVARQVLRPIAGHAVPVPARLPAPAPSPSPACRPARHRRRAFSPGVLVGRNATQVQGCRQAPPRRAAGSRLVRDVRCSAGDRPLARRTARRRTRP